MKYCKEEQIFLLKGLHSERMVTNLEEVYQNMISQISISDKHKYQPLGTDTKIKDGDTLLGEALK